MDNIEAIVIRHDEQLKVQEKSISECKKEIADVKTITQVIYSFSEKMTQLVEQMKEMKTDSLQMKKDIQSLKDEPLQDYKSTKRKVIDTVVTTIVGALVGGAIALAVMYIKMS